MSATSMNSWVCARYGPIGMRATNTPITNPPA